MTSLNTQLQELGLSHSEAEKIATQVQHFREKFSPEECWSKITKEILGSEHPFLIHKLLYETVYPDWKKNPAPAWFPTDDLIQSTHIKKLMNQFGFNNYQDFHDWSFKNYPEFWETMVKELNIIFDQDYKTVVDLKSGIESPYWFSSAKLNIAKSCFNAKETELAIIEQSENGEIKKTTYKELDQLSNRVANSLLKELKVGDKIGIIMPMTTNAIAIFIGIIKAGCCVVPIADSFSASEISTRLKIANVKAIFTQDETIRNDKHVPLYEKMIDANAPFTIVLPAKKKLSKSLRNQDISWNEFLSDNDQFIPVSCEPHQHTTILFSSGTVGKAKAIPWTHTTPIKSASDAYLHLNVKPGDVICLPTDLGWMMGPWLIYAALINKATIALFTGSTKKKEFGKFIQDVNVNLLGVVPTLVKYWRKSACMEGFDWSAIKLFSSTGECSNVDDMLYLMSLANYKPIIEYCGGTEIGGAYITSTMIQPSAPSSFTTPALGLNFLIIDEYGSPTSNGEVALIPPSIGLSTELLNKNHHQIYYADMPKSSTKQVLRRHGDQVEQYTNGLYRLHGRVDDTMNLGGIKVSSVEIESVINTLAIVNESAAIAINPSQGGPSKLIIYAVLKPETIIDIEEIKKEMQKVIKSNLNPLFKIHDVVIVDQLPKTASHKITRRVIRNDYQQLSHLRKTKHKTGIKKICLALQGGGTYGAYTWGILDKFLEDERLEIDAISATSAGSINAVVLANGMAQGGHQGARDALNDFWMTLSEFGLHLSPIRQIISTSGSHLDFDFMAQSSFIFLDLLTRTFSPYLLNPFNFNLIRFILLNKIDFDYLKNHNAIKLFLSATNVKTGMLKIFNNEEISVDAVLASACLPHLSQAIEINKEYYWDGGYLGNPPIYPLIYNSDVDDIIIIHNNPIIRESVPISSTEIDSRVNEISFNSSLLRELRAIAFVTKLVDKGWIKDEYKSNLRRKNVHIIRSDKVMDQFSLINKFNWHWDFLCHLRDLGRLTAEIWLKENFDHLGKKPTIDFLEFLGDDTQTTKEI